jgi:hypothetical protein
MRGRASGWPARPMSFYRRRPAASSSNVLVLHMLSATLTVTPGERFRRCGRRLWPHRNPIDAPPTTPRRVSVRAVLARSPRSPTAASRTSVPSLPRSGACSRSARGWVPDSHAASARSCARSPRARARQRPSSARPGGWRRPLLRGQLAFPPHRRARPGERPLLARSDDHLDLTPDGRTALAG